MSVATSLRRSDRVVKTKRAFSPALEKIPVEARVKRSKMSETSEQHSQLIDGDVDPKTRSKFCCDECGSNYVVKPETRKSTKRRKYRPRYWLDEDTGRKLTLCNACGIRLSKRKTREVTGSESTSLTDEEKCQYTEECQAFVEQLRQRYHTALVDKLVCRNLEWKICGCIQTYIIGESESGVDTDDCAGRVQQLLNMCRTAAKLKAVKYSDTITDNRPIGLGNGRRKSTQYVDYVLTQRKFLREECRLCEKTTRQLLQYSTSLLYYKAKTQQNKQRVEPTMGKTVKHLPSLAELFALQCCSKRCTRVAATQPFLLNHWRDRAKVSQSEAQWVLAEMLIPAAGGYKNCFRFVAMVTGVSLATISKVSQRLKETGGNLRPPEHGLKKFIMERQTLQQPPNSPVDSETCPSPSLFISVENADLHTNSSVIQNMSLVIPTV